MPYFSTLKSAEAAASVPLTYADILYDHAGFLAQNGGKLGPANLAGKSVCIVGAGPAGLCSAFLLAQQGAQVAIVEATDRAGGRVDSLHPIPGDAAIFEMGAMRVPPSEQIFGYYAKAFGVKPGGQFPDPGKVNTKVVFQNATYDWPAGGNPPPIFDNVSAGWGNFANSLSHLTEWLANPALFIDVQRQWQQLVYQSTPPGPEQGYSTVSFYQGLVQAFVENAAKYKCNPWSVDDFSLFGALGLGSGGFGPLYEINFAEIVRLIVNGLESNQQFYPNGLSQLTGGFLATVGDDITFSTKVTNISGGGNGTPVTVTVTPSNGPSVNQQFDAVVVATTTRSMQVDIGMTATNEPILSKEQKSSIRELHLMNSSKLFVLTKSKFWNSNSNLPQNIQTDGLVRGLYCLDYPDSNYGVVLISYTWGDDSTKYIAVKDPVARLSLLLDSLQESVPDFVSAIKPEILPQYTTLVDWQDQAHYYGAFKLNYPGQDPRNQTLYNQFQTSTNGIYLAGDSVGWCGGWIEGALQTGVNAASAVVNQLAGPSGLFPGNPMTQNPNLYNYGP